MTQLMADTEAPTRRRSVWAGYAAATWALLFAIRGIYWALGGSVGLATLSEGIKDLHAQGDRMLFAALWMTVVLELFGVVLGLALVRPFGVVFPQWVPVVAKRRVPNWLLLVPSSGASALLLAHGGTFVGFGLSALIKGETMTTELRWYAMFWGPWFILGGVLFGAAALAYLRWTSDRRSWRRRIGVAAGVVAFLGGLVAAAAPFIVTGLASGSE